MSYEWDEQKRLANVKKHSIDFIDVPEVFDGDVVIIPDERFQLRRNPLYPDQYLEKSGYRRGLHGTR